MPREYQFQGLVTVNAKFTVTANSEEEAHTLVEQGKWDDVDIEAPYEVADSKVDMESCEVVDTL